MNIPTGSRSRLAVAIFRQLIEGGPAVVLLDNGERVAVDNGDWLEIEAIERLQIDTSRRLVLGPTVNRSRLAQRLGVKIDDTQPVLRAPSQNATPAEVEKKRRSIKFALLTPKNEVETREQAEHLARTEPTSGALIVDANSHVGEGFAESMHDAFAAHDVDVLFACSNASEPTSFPMVGNSGSSYERMPGGRSAFQIGEVLRSFVNVVRARPENPVAVMLSPAALNAFAKGEDLGAFSFATTSSAFAWRERDASASFKRGAFGLPVRGDWPTLIRPAGERVRLAKPARPPVVLYSTNVGPWGGVGVLFRLADELQALGLHAFVAHRTTAPHEFTPKTSPAKFGNDDLFVRDIAEVAGSTSGVFVASHWASGRTITRALASNRKWRATTFMQDREDLFESPTGNKPDPSVFSEYLALNRGVAVARWIVDEVAQVYGNDARNYEVIPPGVDARLFCPKPRPANETIRVLAMWRPQTEIRRGSALLRRAYERAFEDHGTDVSLELFGWDGTGSGKAPTFAKHHGALSPAQVADLMASVDIVVEPSLYQGFGLPGLEALMCGAALLSTDCKGPREYATDEQNARVVTHEDLPVALTRLVGDRACIERLRASARASVKSFDWPVVGARWAVHLADSFGDDLPEWRAALDDAKGRALERLSALGKDAPSV